MPHGFDACTGCRRTRIRRSIAHSNAENGPAGTVNPQHGFGVTDRSVGFGGGGGFGPRSQLFRAVHRPHQKLSLIAPSTVD